jgi:hypothetical protein
MVIRGSNLMSCVQAKSEFTFPVIFIRRLNMHAMTLRKSATMEI